MPRIPSDDEALQAAVAALIGHFRLPIEEELCAPEPAMATSAEMPRVVLELVS